MTKKQKKTQAVTPHNYSPVEKDVLKFIEEIENNIRADPQSAETPIIPLNKVTIKILEVKAVKSGKSGLIIKLPYIVYQSNMKRIFTKYVPELEKKTKKHIIFIPIRHIIPTNFKRLGYDRRPASRRLTNVHASLLEDIVAPTEIVGKRTRFRSDGSQVIKIFLDPKEKIKDNIEEKLETFSQAYKALTHKDVFFMFEE